MFLIIIVIISLNMFSSPKISTIQNSTYTWVETDTSFALYNNNAALWQYNFNSIKGKPFFHPINLNQTAITALSPKDHPWHLGLWFSWKYINGVNYWEYDQSPEVEPWRYKGITTIKHVDIEKKNDFSTVIELDIVYHEKNQANILQEKRTIEISKPDKSNFYIDYTFNFKAIVDTVTLDRTPLIHEKNGETYGGYAGLTLRFNQELTNPNFISDSNIGATVHGKSLEWMYYGLKNKQEEQVGAVIFDHPDNLNHPTPWHITNNSKEPLYALQPAPIFNKPLTLYKNDQLVLKYRVKFISGLTDKMKIEKYWDDYINN